MPSRRSFAHLSAEDLAALAELARFYAERRDALSARAQALAASSVPWTALRQGEAGALALHIPTSSDESWDPYLASLYARGKQLARAGVSYSTWFELARAFRDSVGEELTTLLDEDERRPRRTASILRGMNVFYCLALQQISQAYLEIAGAPSQVEAGVVQPSAPAALPGSDTPYRALVADDDEALRRIVVRLLRRADFEVVDVDTGAQAIAALARAPFDVIVSDVQMPDGDGLELLRAVRRVDLDVPVILITGQPSVEAAAAAVEYGAFRYLVKPLDNAELVSSVKDGARAHALARVRREAYRVTGAHAGITDRAGLEVRFEQALEGMWLAFQPIVHASDGALFGVEALMRSSEPSLPNPPALLDAATQLGRLPQLGRRVRALASAAVSARTDSFALFVNLHPEDLHDLELTDEDAPMTRLAPRVILEITERTSLESSPQLTERIARLRQLGFRLAVDDIGAGYSGLTSFAELTPEIVKIDMSLVRDVHRSALKQRTIAALCRLCHESGTLVVGEGVETLEERDTLVEIGCDLLQGYLLGRPQRDLP